MSRLRSGLPTTTKKKKSYVGDLLNILSLSLSLSPVVSQLASEHARAAAAPAFVAGVLRRRAPFVLVAPGRREEEEEEEEEE
jgi:hypothetical protein